MAHPQFTEFEKRTRHTFQAMMWALSHPGCTFDLLASDHNAFVDIGQSLLDLETSFFCEDESLIAQLKATGARHLSSDRASYHFYPELTGDQLDTVKQADIGTLMYPDQSATIFIGCVFGQGVTLQLEGPGIPPNQSQSIQVDGIPLDFWSLRERAIRYPQGWDVYLVSGNQLVGLPRTTRIIVEE